MITIYEARNTAYLWHGGQSSPLYSFASTGTVWSEDHRENTLSEIAECAQESAESRSDKRDLRALADFVKAAPLAI